MMKNNILLINMNPSVKRIHSAKIRSLFKIAPTGVDICLPRGKRVLKIEVKETYGQRAKFCIKPKDMECNTFLFYYPPLNLFLLVKRSQLPKVSKQKATSFSLGLVREKAYFQTTDEKEIVSQIMLS